MLDMKEKPSSLGRKDCRPTSDASSVAFCPVVDVNYHRHLGFRFLRDSQAPKWVIAIVAICGASAALRCCMPGLQLVVEQLPSSTPRMIQPFVFVGPAMAILIWYLAAADRTHVLRSLLRPQRPGVRGPEELHLDLHPTAPCCWHFATTSCGSSSAPRCRVVFGLLVAVLADRSRFEKFAKAMVFMPMAISMVGAAIIWNS